MKWSGILKSSQNMFSWTYLALPIKIQLIRCFCFVCSDFQRVSTILYPSQCALHGLYNAVWDRYKLIFFQGPRIMYPPTSVSVGFGSTERPRNGIFGVFPARKMRREPKTRMRGVGEGKEGNACRQTPRFWKNLRSPANGAHDWLG